MNNNEHINKLIHDTLNSLDGAGKATPKPYLFTRLNARMQNTNESIWDKVLGFISKPVIALTVICLIIAINATVAAFNYTGKSTAVSEEQYISVDEYNSSVAVLNDIENINP